MRILGRILFRSLLLLILLGETGHARFTHELGNCLSMLNAIAANEHPQIVFLKGVRFKRSGAEVPAKIEFRIEEQELMRRKIDEVNLLLKDHVKPAFIAIQPNQCKHNEVEGFRITVDVTDEFAPSLRVEEALFVHEYAHRALDAIFFDLAQKFYSVSEPFHAMAEVEHMMDSHTEGRHIHSHSPFALHGTTFEESILDEIQSFRFFHSRDKWTIRDLVRDLEEQKGISIKPFIAPNELHANGRYHELLADLITVLTMRDPLAVAQFSILREKPVQSRSRAFTPGFTLKDIEEKDGHELFAPVRSFIAEHYLNNPSLTPVEIFNVVLKAAWDDITDPEPEYLYVGKYLKNKYQSPSITKARAMNRSILKRLPLFPIIDEPIDPTQLR
jgi:hypothetical protein